MRWVLSFGAPYFVGLRYCRGEQRKARGRGRCDGVGECAVLQWVPGGRKRVLACLSEAGSRGQLWLGLPLARQKVLLRDGEGSALRWLVQRVALAGAVRCDGWCSVLRLWSVCPGWLRFVRCGVRRDAVESCCRHTVLVGQTGRSACVILLPCPVLAGSPSRLRWLAGWKILFHNVPHLIVRPICCAKAEIVIPL